MSTDKDYNNINSYNPMMQSIILKRIEILELKLKEIREKAETRLLTQDEFNELCDILGIKRKGKNKTKGKKKKRLRNKRHNEIN